jgi:hypothetical protein
LADRATQRGQTQNGERPYGDLSAIPTRRWAAQVGSVLIPELVATIQSAHGPDRLTSTLNATVTVWLSKTAQRARVSSAEPPR